MATFLLNDEAQRYVDHEVFTRSSVEVRDLEYEIDLVAALRRLFGDAGGNSHAGLSREARTAQ